MEHVKVSQAALVTRLPEIGKVELHVLRYVLCRERLLGYLKTVAVHFRMSRGDLYQPDATSGS